MDKDLPYFLALSQVPSIGAKRFKVLLEHFDSAQEVWKSSEQTLKQILEPAVFKNFISFRTGVSPQNLLEDILMKNIQVISLLDKNYPTLLRQIFDPPPVVYVKGEIKSEDSKSLAVVGTRKITSYGREVTESLVAQLSSYSLTIISGLARGVDALAHKTALENGARTIAVLGCGVDVVYPMQNKDLVGEVVKNGALVSEYPPGTQPLPGYFPARNRIISGLSLGVLITEADEKSGSLITAGTALEQNREVFAVPGPIYSKLSSGPTKLLKQGAKLVSNAEDIVEELNLGQGKVAKKFQKPIGDNNEEVKIIDLLESETKHIDQLSRESKLSSEKLNGLLLTMELSGKIKNIGGGNYRLSH